MTWTWPGHDNNLMYTGPGVTRTWPRHDRDVTMTSPEHDTDMQRHDWDMTVWPEHARWDTPRQDWDMTESETWQHHDPETESPSDYVKMNKSSVGGFQPHPTMKTMPLSGHYIFHPTSNIRKRPKKNLFSKKRWLLQAPLNEHSDMTRREHRIAPKTKLPPQRGKNHPIFHLLFPAFAWTFTQDEVKRIRHLLGVISVKQSMGSSQRRSCCLEHLIPCLIDLNPQLLAHCSSFSRKMVIYLLLICSLSTAQLVLASWQRQFPPPLCQVAANDRAWHWKLLRFHASDNRWSNIIPPKTDHERM